MKRFWKQAEVTRSADGFAVTLDGRPLKTPAKAPMVLPTEKLAKMVADEWNAVEGEVRPENMPATRMSNAAIDKVSAQFDDVAEMLSEYGDSDLLCYRATGPEGLIDQQVKKWDPLLEWAAATLGARLTPISGIIHQPQSRAAQECLRKQVFALSSFELSAFHDLVTISGSLVLAFATTKSLLPLEELWSRACLDELWQEQQWGEDDEALALRARKKNDFFHAARFFAFCNQPMDVQG